LSESFLGTGADEDIGLQSVPKILITSEMCIFLLFIKLEAKLLLLFERGE
jgi:hypothetical protein